MKGLVPLSIFTLAWQLSVFSVAGFATVRPMIARVVTPTSLATRPPKTTNAPQSTAASMPQHASPLFCQSHHSLPINTRRLSLWKRLWQALRQSRWSRKIRHALVVLLAVASVRCTVLPAQASSTAVSTSSLPSPKERLLASSKADALVDRYVQQHLFHDDLGKDPIASIYREGFYDAVQGKYPAAVQQVTADVWGGAAQGGATSIQRTDRGNLFTAALQVLQKRLGLDQGAALAVLAAGCVVAAPFSFLVVGMIIGGASKRNMNRVMKKRYGDTYTVDATIKTEEDVEAPDDDEDEDDEDKKDDDDDDDDDE